MNRHFILSLGRSGSNYLVSCLNSHPQAVNYGEIMGHYTLPYKLHETLKIGGDNYGKHLELMYSNSLFYYAAQFYSLYYHLRTGKPLNFKGRHTLKTLGMKDFAYNFEKLGIPNYLIENDILVINLYRKNIFRRYVSLMKLRETGIAGIDFRTRSASQEINKVSSSKLVLDLNLTLETLKIFEEELERQQKLANRIPETRVFNICYEDLFSSPEAQEKITTQLFRFLGIDTFSVKGTHRKILSNRFEDVIDNFDEIREGLMGTRFSKFINT